MTRMTCDRCRQDFDLQTTLFAAVNGRVICSECWHRAGSPFPRREASVAEIHAAELAIRERMQARGGADRHMVRSGKS